MNPAPPLRTITDIGRLLEAHAASHALLLHVESLGLPDAWIGAGFIRNSVWDTLHGRTIDVTRLADVDVLFFDPDDTSKEREAGIERRLRMLAPDIPWSVKNQARMHLRNADAPYRNTLDAVAHWAETATAIAAQSIRGAVKVMAPYGVDDLLNLIVRPTPVFGHKIDVYREPVMAKGWPARWPNLTVLISWEAAYPAPHNPLDKIET
jgi:hypothetical protein